MRIIVSFSGGKDSQACLIKACKEYGTENVTVIKDIFEPEEGYSCMSLYHGLCE